MNRNQQSEVDEAVRNIFQPGDVEALRRFVTLTGWLEAQMRIKPGIKSFVAIAALGGVTRLLREQIIPSMERQGR